MTQKLNSKHQKILDKVFIHLLKNHTSQNIIIHTSVRPNNNPLTQRER